MPAHRSVPTGASLDLCQGLTCKLHNSLRKPVLRDAVAEGLLSVRRSE